MNRRSLAVSLVLVLLAFSLGWSLSIYAQSGSPEIKPSGLSGFQWVNATTAVVAPRVNTSLLRIENVTAQFDSTHTLEWELLYGGEWFLFNSFPRYGIDETFLGVFDLSAFGIPCILSDHVYYVTKNGASTFTAINETYGGLRLTTGATAGNDCTVSSGDNTGRIYPWNISRGLYFRVDFRLPTSSDLNNVTVLIGFYYDQNNYIAIRYNSTKGYLESVTRAAGNETATNIGAPDNEWHTAWGRASQTEIKVVYDGATTVTHTTNIPSASPLSHYMFIETSANASRSVDIRHLTIIQSPPG